MLRSLARRETCGHAGRHIGALPIWGDGFEADSFRQIASARDWDDISNDELIRFYPRLLETTSRRLLPHVECCVTTLRLQSITCAHRSTWSPAPTKAYLAGLATGELHMLDEIIDDLQTGHAERYAPDRAEMFAFHTSVHPAYFWPEAVLSHQRLTTMGWLGVVMRGRSALMTYDVAEYLNESANDPYSDSALTRRMGSREMASTLLRHAALRLQGREVVSSASTW